MIYSLIIIGLKKNVNKIQIDSLDWNNSSLFQWQSDLNWILTRERKASRSDEKKGLHGDEMKKRNSGKWRLGNQEEKEAEKERKKNTDVDVHYL